MQSFRQPWIREMTIFPQAPNLVDSQTSGFKKLAEPHLTFVEVGFGYYLWILIGEGFETDGASVPTEWLHNSKFVDTACKLIAKKYQWMTSSEMLDFLIGTPFEMPRLLAAIVHDALYSFHWKWRILCDWVYKKILEVINYDSTRKTVEHLGIRIMGGKNWDSVTKQEKINTRKMVTVKFVREKNLKLEIIKLLQKS